MLVPVPESPRMTDLFPGDADAGAGLAYRDATEASEMLRAMLAEPSALWEMGQRGLRMRRADATERILDMVQSMVLAV